MGKKDSTNKKQEEKITNRCRGRGRPSKKNANTLNQYSQKQHSNSSDTQNVNQQQFWFTSDKTNEIVRILASKCQIIFKCLSGQSANNLKTSFYSATQPQISFNDFKHKRQLFAENATKLQTQLLKKLEEYLTIKLIGEKKQMNYFFFENNTFSDTTQENQKKEIDLLCPIINKDFLQTLNILLEIASQPESSNLNLEDIYNINKHKHLVSWAFVLAWGEDVRKHLIRLQQKIESENTNNEIFENLTKQSDMILQTKQQEVQNIENIDELIENYQNSYKKEIDDLITLLRQRFANNNIQ